MNFFKFLNNYLIKQCFHVSSKYAQCLLVSNKLSFIRNGNCVIKNNLYTSAVISQKFQVEHENVHNYETLQSLPIYKDTLASKFGLKNEIDITDITTFNNLLNKNFQSESASEILNTFKRVCKFCELNNISLSDIRFDKLVDGLMNNCERLTDEELAELLFYISKFPRPESIESHNFHDIWSCLDDMCLKRFPNWSLEKLFLFCDLFYLLGLAKYSDFTIESIKKFCRRVKCFNKRELVQSLFYINICRKNWSIFDFELKLEKLIHEFTLDEIGLVCSAFFKTQSSFKSTFLPTFMINQILENSTTVHEITLTSILKMVRYSPHLRLTDQLIHLFDKLLPEIDRLSTLCCIHIALLGTNSQLFHAPILQKITEKIFNNLSNVRLKDLERLVFVLTLFNFKPRLNVNFFQEVLKEVQKKEREEEIDKYPRCFACLLHYLGLQKVYSEEFLNKVLSPEFIRNAYGINKQKIGREILYLDQSIPFDLPNYSGNRLPQSLQIKLTIWNTDYIPYKNQKYRLTAADKLFLEIVDYLEDLYGKKSFFCCHILPHFSRPDILLCKDSTGKFIDAEHHFQHYNYGTLLKPPTNFPNEQFKYFVIIIGSWNMFIRNSEIPVGTLIIKQEQLKVLGYQPVLISWMKFTSLSKKEKEDYLLNCFT